MTRLNVLKSLPLGFWMALLLNAFPTVSGEDFPIDWRIRAFNQPYEDLNATIGDTITFSWPIEDAQTVYINPTRTCSPQGAIFIGDMSPVTYMFNQSGPVYFADNIDRFCEWNMRFTVFVGNDTASPSSTPTQGPTVQATASPTLSPTAVPTTSPTAAPSSTPSAATVSPTNAPSASPTITSSGAPTTAPSSQPSNSPSDAPSPSPSSSPSAHPSPAPSDSPSTSEPTGVPSKTPTAPPVTFPTDPPTFKPTTNPTSTPTVTPTVTPTASPTIAPTVKVTEVSTKNPTKAPTKNPTKAPTKNPTKAPVPAGESISETIVGLKMGIAGVTDFTPDAISQWQALTEEYSSSFVFNDLKDSVTNYNTVIDVTDFAPYVNVDSRRHQRMMRGENRNLQDQQDIIIVEYTQSVTYNIVGIVAQITTEELVAAPFATDAERAAYVTVLKTSDDPVLSEVRGVSEVDIPVQPTQAPEPVPKRGLSTTAIIGISCGGGGLLIVIVLFWIYCSSGGDEGEDKEADPPLHVDVRNDEVSTLAGPDGPPTYGDQSVATVDYDYSKAYGGAGDTSVSSAGGTFGSQTQNISLPNNAAATGAALGSMESNSYDDRYDSPRSSIGNEEVIHIFAPPGKLGVVIDTPDDGAPVVHAVKDTSVIADRIIVGDKLVAVDDEDVRSMTAIKVSKMISRKGANPSRKLTIVRTVPREE